MRVTYFIYFQPCEKWSMWTVWTICSVSCGEGSQSRSRTCQYGTEGMTGCIGEPTQTRQCFENECPYWGDWQEWSICSSTCGGGSRTKRRMCYRGTAGEEGCLGSSIDTDDCNSKDCPRWGQWTDFEQCTALCDGGVQVCHSPYKI